MPVIVSSLNAKLLSKFFHHSSNFITNFMPELIVMKLLSKILRRLQLGTFLYRLDFNQMLDMFITCLQCFDAFTHQMFFLMPSKLCQSTEGTGVWCIEEGAVFTGAPCMMYRVVVVV